MMHGRNKLDDHKPTARRLPDEVEPQTGVER
jgi:hypothetical protein